MAQPKRTEVHVDQPLTNLSIAYIQQADNFAADSIAPRVPVQKQSDKYPTYTKSYWMQNSARRRAPGTESAGSGYGIEWATYECEVWAVHKDLDDQTAANTDNPLDATTDAVNFVTEQMLIARESQVASTVFQASTWTGSTTGADISVSTKWDDATSTPIEDVRTQAFNIREVTGRKPNLMVVGPEVFAKLADHPDILDRIKYTQRGIVTPDLIAAVFDVDRFVIPFATRNTAEEGATGSYSFFWGKNAWLGHVAPNPGLRTPSALYNFIWTGYAGANAYGIGVDSFRMDELKAERYEAELAFDVKVVGADLAAYFTSVVS